MGKFDPFNERLKKLFITSESFIKHTFKVGIKKFNFKWTDQFM